MSISEKQLSRLNESVYSNLEKILKQLNKRLHIRLYSMVYDEKDQSQQIVRLKKTVSVEGRDNNISQDKLLDIEDLYSELKLDLLPIDKDLDLASAQKHLVQHWTAKRSHVEKKHSADAAASDDTTKGERITTNPAHQDHDSRIISINKLKLQEGDSLYTIVYVLEVQYVERDTQLQFYTNRNYSFLKMVVDYYFLDYFAVNEKLAIQAINGEFKSKYNENSLEFNRRMTRLFFGKMQGYLQSEKADREYEAEYENTLRSEYYIHDLLEKLDDISTKTYENANPFGSILFMNSHVIERPNLINFTVRFKEKKRIRLDDAKRIRKLLELTNLSEHLYLISDGVEIYGLGEINWNMQKNALALRVDFKGISKYSLVYICTEEDELNAGKVFIEEEKKFFHAKLRLLELELVSVSFKNPRLGEEGYTYEKLHKLLTKEFNEEGKTIDSEKVAKLDQIVRKAKEQKHGTMVVITDEDTAISELDKLGNQSTLIEPGNINPDYIKYLTSIDGAIYFDTDGRCHAIGVILDGIAIKDIGDAARGARFNSAHRYLQKLKNDTSDEKHPKGKKCVIIIISEDGMVDLIPELESEHMLISLAQEVIDMINQEQMDTSKLDEKERILLASNIVDSDWLFTMGKAHFEKEKYERALDFFERAIQRAADDFVPSKYYNYLSNCYYKRKDVEGYLAAIYNNELALVRSDRPANKRIYYRNAGNASYYLGKLYNERNTSDHQEYRLQLEKTIDYYNDVINFIKLPSTDTKLDSDDFNNRAISYDDMGVLETGENRKSWVYKAIRDYTTAIEINPNDVYYSNRALSYQRIKMMREAIEDVISAEIIEHEGTYINRLRKLLDTNKHLIPDTIAFYNDLKTKSTSNKQLESLFETYNHINLEEITRIAAATQQPKEPENQND